MIILCIRYFRSIFFKRDYEMRSFFFCAGVLLLSSLSFAQMIMKKEKMEIPNNWVLVDDPSYSLYYPDSFDLDKTGQMGLDVILLSRPTSKNDLFRDNINLMIQNLENTGIDLKQYVEISENQIKTVIPEVHILESKTQTKNNKTFHRIVYTGKQEPYSLKWLQYYWVEKNKAYVLTLTCEINQYNHYVKVGEKIINTFKLK